jgi:hypothetical protein
MLLPEAWKEIFAFSPLVYKRKTFVYYLKSKPNNNKANPTMSNVFVTGAGYIGNAVAIALR